MVVVVGSQKIMSREHQLRIASFPVCFSVALVVVADFISEMDR